MSLPSLVFARLVAALSTTGRRLVVTVSVAVLALAGLLLPASDAFAANLTIDQCNGVGASSSGATTGMTCTVTVVNTISGGHVSSTTTVTRLCSLAPCAPGDGTFVTHSTSLVTRVTQCNGSDNDAAHPITCTVTITNNISADTAGANPVTSATSNQCVGSATGGGGSVVCDPFPATTTGATVTQCNGSATGGGGTIDCSVGSASTISPAVPIRVNQCNGTGNPGGSVVTCSTTITTNITAAVVTATPTPSATSPSSAAAKAAAARAAAAKAAAAKAARSTGQVARVPAGGVAAGGASGTGLQHEGELGLGLLLIGAAAVLARRRGSFANPGSRHQR